MNELTRQLLLNLWILDGLYFGVFFPLIIYSILFTFSNIKSGINNQNKIINDFFGFQDKGYEINFISPKLRRLNTKIFSLQTINLFFYTFLIANIWFLFYTIGTVNWAEKVDINYLIIPLTIFGLIIILYILIIGFSFLLGTKKNKSDLSDEEIIKKYRFFKENWIKNNGSNYLNIKLVTDNNSENITVKFKKHFILNKFNFFHTEYSTINQFRNILYNIYRNMKKIEKKIHKHNITFVITDTGENISFDQLKDIWCNNFLTVFFEKNIIPYKKISNIIC